MSAASKRLRWAGGPMKLERLVSAMVAFRSPVFRSATACSIHGECRRVHASDLGLRSGSGRSASAVRSLGFASDPRSRRWAEDEPGLQLPENASAWWPEPSKGTSRIAAAAIVPRTRTAASRRFAVARVTAPPDHRGRKHQITTCEIGKRHAAASSTRLSPRLKLAVPLPAPSLTVFLGAQTSSTYWHSFFGSWSPRLPGRWDPPQTRRDQGLVAAA